MKNNLMKIFGKTMNAVILLTFAAGASMAQNAKGGGGRLEGTWEARVTIRVCATGAEIRSFDSLGIFMKGGTMIDSTSGIPQALKTPGQGVWDHVEGNTYRFKFKSFSFNAAGAYTGYSIIQHEANLNSNADGYASTGTAAVYLPNGTLVFSGCSTTTATRFE